jgi:hypothetical protein
MRRETMVTHQAHNLRVNNSDLFIAQFSFNHCILILACLLHGCIHLLRLIVIWPKWTKGACYRIWKRNVKWTERKHQCENERMNQLALCRAPSVYKLPISLPFSFHPASWRLQDWTVSSPSRLLIFNCQLAILSCVIKGNFYAIRSRRVPSMLAWWDSIKSNLREFHRMSSYPTGANPI